MKNIIMITSSFPYYPGEQFIETEIVYCSLNSNLKFMILPLSYGNKIKRDIPGNIVLDDSLADYISKIPKKNNLLRLFDIIVSKNFYRELFLENLFNINKFRYFSSSILRFQIYYNAFDHYFSKKSSLLNTVVYTYWHNEATYALQKLKKKYHYKLVSRIHGGDLYQERRPFGYLPLKKQFNSNLNKIFTITESADEYLHLKYGFNEKIIELSRLGVDDHGLNTFPTKLNNLHIVSCSFLTKIKQVHKIIEAIEVLSKKIKDVNFEWTHIGSGPLFVSLKDLASEKLDILGNVTFNFIGELKNNDVYRFYKKNNVDVFINVSESEGVPVSIMEAMSCHIPIIAPNVGGISDMVINGYNGLLIGKICSVREIVASLEKINFYKNNKTREKSYKIYLEKYNAKENYNDFLYKLERIT